MTLPKPEGYDQAKFDDDKKKAVFSFNGTAAAQP